MTGYVELSYKEPYRFFFSLGILLLLCGALIWVPLIWTADIYPVELHRYLMLNGFAGCFIGGFLMTAAPRFSQTWNARGYEVITYFLITAGGLIPAHMGHTMFVFLFSSLQPLAIIAFLIPRMLKRKANPPKSFVFMFAGLLLWMISGVLSMFVDQELFKPLHYEGAIACIILGVGSRLIPGILGHVEIINPASSQRWENLIFFLVPVFVGSYFLNESHGIYIRALVLIIIGFKFWYLHKTPQIKSALTWSIWISSWLILVSFVLKALWPDGMIHISHSFFINGIVLLSLLIGTRVLQSHGPKRSELENSKILYVVTFCIVLAAATRVSAFMIPEMYLSHLAYSSIMLCLGAIIWAIKYLRYVNTSA